MDNGLIIETVTPNAMHLATLDRRGEIQQHYVTRAMHNICVRGRRIHPR